ncbi:MULTISPECIES: histidine--tRNA ligase [Bacillus]|uniref:histidine--tRNA ligase n=1 Tax=Bacillus TaxID=1386 RepID=UPI0005D462CA|nr:histidine--tRNA ligase [Bacillus altitudinis]KQL40472.1 histidyl-tRNA synthetase [Bacillus sp. FJAT-21955]KJF48558.1 histidyl-tRNA synthetase [Bacillus altitudinis]MBU8652783.1 histidine--tRNA ligase [Bacillus altitudinis]MBU8778023.1 histidine--tRNA ligase [Bacillus altitudinis]MCY7450653.1 histidine--tRNA ligase [Bacillus altitudinis]
MSFNIPRGTQDILPGESERWQYVEQIARETCAAFQYKEIRTPIFEHTELFARGVGESTDIVQKEMYTFEDKKGRSITLRPEGTASTVRSYVENKLFAQPAQPTKLYYIGPMFRYERPQTGRYRQFYQFGIEAIGSKDPAIDAEVISLAMSVYEKAGLSNLKLVINSLGDKESRADYRQALVEHFEPRIDEFCHDCQIRLHQNPLRILDCKKDRDHELMATAPSIQDYLNEESRTYFEKVKQYLTDLGIEYVVDPNLVRGLDYYNHTAFEIMSNAEGFGAITTLAGGGRYDGLVEGIGGPESPGIGFAMSIERFLSAIDAEKIELPVQDGIDLYIAALGDQAKDYAVGLLNRLRKEGISSEMDYTGKKLKAQFKAADRLKAKFIAVLGEDELAQQIVNVKDTTTGEQIEVKLDELIQMMKAHQKA